MTHDTATPKVKADCPVCGPEKIADVLASRAHTEHDDTDPVWLEVELKILQCRGCETLFVYKGEHFSEDVDIVHDPHTGGLRQVAHIKKQYWPSSKSRPKWAPSLETIDTDLANLFEEVHSARNAELYVLSTIGVRTVFDRATEILKVDPNKSFAGKLDLLAQGNRISVDERAALEVLIEAGNAAAHRGWRPSRDEVDGLVLIMESFLHRCFIADYLAKAIKSSVPGRIQSASAKTKPSAAD